MYLAVPSSENTDSYDNYANVRFRHNNDRITNALCVDGHVETFQLRIDNVHTSLQRSNINVNLDQ
jgi:prepilin-type processing-associated H-X9-DG protein